MKRRLLALAQAAHHLGGVPVWLNGLIPHLESRGWDIGVGLVARSHGEVRRFRDGYPGLERCSFGIVVRADSALARAHALGQAVGRRAPDVVLVSDVVEAYPACAQLRHTQGKEIRLVMALHGLHPGYFEDMASLRGVLDAVICSNRLTAELCLTEGGLSEDQVRYAPYGVPTPPALRPAGECGGPLRVAWVGRLERFQKRCMDLVGIVRALQRRGVCFTLTIAGEGPAGVELRKAFEHEVERGVVRFLGALPADRVRDSVYPVADVLLVTSLWETGPLVAWEAMQAGVAVAASRYLGSGLEASLKPGENCVQFMIGDVEGAAEEVERLGAGSLRAKLVETAFRMVRERHSAAVSLAAWEGALAATLDQPTRGDVPAGRPLGPSGRLDRWFGTRLGGGIREVMSLLFSEKRSREPWPFTAGQSSPEDPSFWSRVAAVDGAVLPMALAREAQEAAGTISEVTVRSEVERRAKGPGATGLW